ncbi:MAG TPA: DUF2802 domain-containing protein [Rhodocyclaceae bacterium]|nr:DUF2802 domain-containing protein [Rhodocyclaceae bacterium]
MNIQLGSLSLGWREMVLAAVVMLGVYMLFVAWLMRRLRRHALPKSVPVEPTVQAAAAGAAAYAANATAGEAEPTLNAAPEAAAQGEPEPDDAPIPERSAVIEDGLRRELAQMRDELDALRSEFAALRADLQHEAAQLKAQQAVSPLYSDAMKMAGAGHGAALIAERCGISRAEAELVVALVKSQD